MGVLTRIKVVGGKTILSISLHTLQETETYIIPNWLYTENQY